MRIAIVIALAAALGAAPLVGCAGRVQRVTTQQTLECQELERFDEEEPRKRECSEVRRETTLVTGHDSDCHGVVSCSIGLVGRIVTLPFRIVGVVLETFF